jgi:hypothetical protein
MIHTHSGAHAPGHSNGHRGRWAAAALALLFSVVVAFVPGCGGGVGTGGTGSFSSGPIAGLGSIVVNSVRFEYTGAQVLDDQGARFNDDLAVGMVVDVNSDAITGTADALRATASTVRVNRFLRAPVTAVNSSAGTFTALGLVVRTSAATFYGSSLPSGVASLTANVSVVTVYGFFDAASSEVRATRVEAANLGAAPWELRAPVSTVVGSTFTVGTQSFNFGSLTAPVAGSDVRVFVNPPVSPGTGWQVVSFGQLQRELPDDDDAKVRGFVSRMGSATASFQRIYINGVTVDVPIAQAGPLVQGARVEVEGRLVAGVLIASSVSIESASEDNDEFKFIGPVSSWNAAAKTFVLKNETVYYGGAGVEFEDGLSATSTYSGKSLNVRGVRSGGLIRATRVRLQNAED